MKYRSICVVSSALAALTATASVLDMYGKELWSQSMDLPSLPEDSTAE